MENASFVRNGVLRLPPGFRFHPTDEELVVQYLRRKVLACPLPAFVIPEVDICKYEPWDLPGDSEQERYYFSSRELKHRSGNRPNRATGFGYWKATGLDKKIVASKSNQLIGMKKTLVFYRGKSSKASKTDWIMHEYRLVDTHMMHSNQKPIVDMEDWVICRVFRKKTSGKKGGSVRVEWCNKSREAVLDLTLGRSRPSIIEIASAPSSPSSSTSPASSGITEESVTGSYSDDNSVSSFSCRREI